MKLRTVLSTALATGAVALGVGAVAALGQEDREQPALPEQRGDHGPMMGSGDGAMMHSMHRHHAEMMREMRDIDPEMARMMDRHHKEMMGQMHKGGMGALVPE